MSFQFPESSIPASASPAPNLYPAILVRRETADIPVTLSQEDRERAARRITREVLDAFWYDMGVAHHSAAMQCCPTHPLHDWYAGSAAANRDDIAAQLAATYL